MNFLERFRKNVAGSKNKHVDYIAKIEPSGDFQKVEGIEAILNSWMNLLRTPVRTYVFDPNYGSELYKRVFDPADEITMDAIKTEIKEKLMYYDNRASITNVNIKFLPDKKGFVVDIFVRYKGEITKISKTFDKESFFNLIQ